MTKPFNQYTECSNASDWQSMAAYIAWAVVPLTAVVTPLMIAAPWCIPFYLLALGAAGGVAACDWWLNIRLVCLGGDQYAVGMVVSAETSRSKKGLFGSLDTDYSLNLLVYPCAPGVSQADAEASQPYGSLMAETQGVKDNIKFFQGIQAPEKDEDGQGGPTPANPTSAVLHAEFEGAGMRDFRVGMLVALGFAIAAVIACAAIPPPWGMVTAAILTLLAFLAGLIGWLAGDHAYTDPGDGAIPGVVRPNDPTTGLGGDLMFVSGRWVFDSFHEGWNELHPIKICIPMGTWTGIWPADIPELALRMNTKCKEAEDLAKSGRQEQLQWQWSFHPYVDGCGDWPPLQPPGVAETTPQKPIG